VVLALWLVLGVAGAAPVAAAPTGGSASISDSHPQPGQGVTVRASGLLPGGVAYIDYIPDGARLATVHAGADGSFVHTVQIPIDSPDGKKQIVVTALDSEAHYAYLANDLTVKGPSASARLSDTSLVPGQALRISGNRFLVGTDVYAVLYPEGAILMKTTARSGGGFSAGVTMPTKLLNGRHGIAVVGLTYTGDVAYLQLFANVTGGIGTAAGDPFANASHEIPADVTTTTTEGPSTTTTDLAPLPTHAPSKSSLGPHGTDTGLVLAIVLALAVATGAALLASWLRSPAGRRWRRDRSNRRLDR
jgi:hypothetical protein